MPPSRKDQDDSLEDLELPLLQAVALQVSVLAIALFTRVTDVLVLCVRPWLLRPYLGVWLAESLFPIHHKRPLEYAHLFPAEDIGSAENLAMVRKAVHERINAVWNRFRQSHAGATRREVEEATRIVDEWFEPWYHRIDDPPGLTYSLLDAEQNALKALQRLSSHLP